MTRLPSKLPTPIRRYLDVYPQFNVADDVMQSFVRTSIESFHFAAKVIHRSLTAADIVWSTDNLGLALDFAHYWTEEGLQYLRVNHEASGRGVRIERIFVVLEHEYQTYRAELSKLRALHAMTGVATHVAIYERLPRECRYDFALWGNKYVDEVVYDIKSNHIIDNRIHWSPGRYAQFAEKIKIIRNLVEVDWSGQPERVGTFDDVLSYAASIREELDRLGRGRRVQATPDGETPGDMRPFRILLLSANPIGTKALRLDEEHREIDMAIQASRHRDRFRLEKQHATRVQDIQAHLLRFQPDLVHFSGHGNRNSMIVLEDKRGKAQAVPSRALSRLFSVLKDNIRCVFLNACYSEEQAQAISAHIPCVIGMSAAIGDQAAIKFATAFYQGIAYGRSFGESFDLGRVQIELEDLKDDEAPRMLCQDPRTASVALF